MGVPGGNPPGSQTTSVRVGAVVGAEELVGNLKSVWGSGFRVQGFRMRVQVSGFEIVQGFVALFSGFLVYG